MSQRYEVLKYYDSYKNRKILHIREFVLCGKTVLTVIFITLNIYIRIKEMSQINNLNFQIKKLAKKNKSYLKEGRVKKYKNTWIKLKT